MKTQTKRLDMANDAIDSHFHIWDVCDSSSGHKLDILGGPATLHPQYTTQASPDYEYG